MNKYQKEKEGLERNKKRQETVENHDCPCPDNNGHTEKERIC